MPDVPCIARLGAERADEQTVEALRGHLETMRTAADDAAFVDADVAFHLELARAANNSVLSDILVSIRSLLRVWIRRAISVTDGIDVTTAEHTAVLEAVAEGSPERAAEAMREHMDAAGKRLQNSLGNGPAASESEGNP